jgi:hypothetical protein
MEYLIRQATAIETESHLKNLELAHISTRVPICWAR